MLAPEHLDDDAVERADRRHGGPHDIVVPDALPQIAIRDSSVPFKVDLGSALRLSRRLERGRQPA